MEIIKLKEKYLGKSVTELPTPALLLNLDLFEKNLEKMADYTKAAGIHFRPHAKAHKSPEIARRQLTSGAIGISCATIKEAEVMVAENIAGVLITSPMAGANKTARLIQATKQQSTLMSVVDNLAHVKQLKEAAAEANVSLNLLIDVDPNLNRTGVKTMDEAFAIAEFIQANEMLQLKGVQCYSGSSAHIKGFDARYNHSKAATEIGLEIFKALKSAGYPVEIMTGGSTGTYNIDPTFGVMTELQVGSFIFMDTDYKIIGGKTSEMYQDFAQALTVLTTVVSKNHAGIATVDAGLKALATDRTFLPQVKTTKQMTYAFSGDEHGRIEFREDEASLNLGDQLEIIAPHCDPTVNLYRNFFCIRGGVVEDIWQITAKY